MNTGVVNGWRRAIGGRAARTWFLVGLGVLVAAGAVVALADHPPGRTSAKSSSVTFGGAPSPQRGALAPATPTGSDTAGAAAGAAGSAGGGAASTSVASPEPAPALQEQAAPAPVPNVAPQVVRTAELAVEVPKGRFVDAVDRANGVAAGLGGFVVSSTTSSFEAGRSSGDITIRVPADRFEAARHQLAGLGHLTSEQVSGQDVTAQLVDYDARLRALRAEEDSLTTLLGRAGTIGEVLQVRSQLSATRTEIEQLAGQQKQLSDQATFSTLHVALAEKGAVLPAPPRPPQPERGLVRSLHRAGAAFVAVVGGMVVVAAVVAPFLVLVGLFLLLFRLRRRPRTA